MIRSRSLLSVIQASNVRSFSRDCGIRMTFLRVFEYFHNTIKNCCCFIRVSAVEKRSHLFGPRLLVSVGTLQIEPISTRRQAAAILEARSTSATEFPAREGNTP